MKLWPLAKRRVKPPPVQTRLPRFKQRFHFYDSNNLVVSDDLRIHSVSFEETTPLQTSPSETMSIFDDTPTRPARTSKASSSLFDDDAPNLRGSPSLFADDTSESTGAGDSPWSFPTPKKAARSQLIKTLLPASDVPDLYVDVLDKLLAVDKDAGINAKVVVGLLRESGIDAGCEGQGPGRRHARARAEGEGARPWGGFCAVGFDRAGPGGDEITIDGVDERRKSMLMMLAETYTMESVLIRRF